MTQQDIAAHVILALAHPSVSTPVGAPPGCYMFDPQALSTALLTAVHEDGHSIGNQSLLEVLKG